MLAFAVITAMREPPGSLEPGTPRKLLADDGSSADLAHCRRVAAPDPTCAAAWEARRRRFFGMDDKRDASRALQERAGHE